VAVHDTWSLNMGCTPNKPVQNGESALGSSTAFMTSKRQLRKQLTLSGDGFGDFDASSGEEGSPNSDRKKKKSEKTALRRSFSCSSVTEGGGKANFSEKAKSSTDNDVNPEDFGIYVTCRKGSKAGSPPNQDSWYIRKYDHFAVYGVFDGHGKYGHDVSNYVKRHLPTLIENDARFKGPEQHEAVIEAFDKVTRMINVAAEKGELNCERSGTTATIAIHDPGRELLITAHVGDSGAALARGPQQKAMYLTPDHKPNLPVEMKRINAQGGSIEFDGYNYRVYKVGERGPGLNMSRALGDLLGRTCGISSMPDINQVRLSAGDRYLLLCSDGVWEWILPQEAFDICHKALMSGGNPAKDLAFAASNAWVENADDVIDDITVIFVDLANGGEACKFEPMKKPKGILKRSKTGDSITTHNSDVTTASQISGSLPSSFPSNELTSHGMNKAKDTLRRSKTGDSIGTHNSSHTSGSITSGALLAGKENSTLAKGNSSGSLSTPSMTESVDGNKDISAICADASLEDESGFDILPSARVPEKPLKSVLQLSRSNYVASGETQR